MSTESLNLNEDTDGGAPRQRPPRRLLRLLIMGALGLGLGSLVAWTTVLLVFAPPVPLVVWSLLAALLLAMVALYKREKRGVRVGLTAIFLGASITVVILMSGISAGP